MEQNVDNSMDQNVVVVDHQIVQKVVADDTGAQQDIQTILVEKPVDFGVKFAEFISSDGFFLCLSILFLFIVFPKSKSCKVDSKSPCSIIKIKNVAYLIVMFSFLILIMFLTILLFLTSSPFTYLFLGFSFLYALDFRKRLRTELQAAKSAIRGDSVVGKVSENKVSAVAEKPIVKNVKGE